MWEDPDDFKRVTVVAALRLWEDEGWSDRSTPLDDLHFEFEKSEETITSGGVKKRRFRASLVSELSSVTIGFPWWDRVSDMRHFLNWLRDVGDGGDFSDCDQGWLLLATRRGDRFHFLDGNNDTGEEYANVSVGRDRLLADLDAKLKQFRRRSWWGSL